MQIIPAILEKDFEEIQRKLEKVSGLVSSVQIDVCDGKFVPNTTWPYAGDGEIFEALKTEKTGLPHWQEFDFEFDLMVREPEAVIGDYVKMGAVLLVVHLSSTKQFSEILEEWGHAVEIGAAISPAAIPDEIAALESFADKLAFVQVMGIERVGFQGQSFDERAPETIAMLRRTFPNLAISVDGGVSLETAPRLIAAGASRLVAGSAIFGSDNIRETLEKLKNCG